LEAAYRVALQLYKSYFIPAGGKALIALGSGGCFIDSI